ncbi:hypothetical protein BKD30_03950 [Tersicoccus phoenicis]|uniref:Integral membrane protein n=1 Tax=Tersicoccus phoenicis TaxID=554083 RepID=A0A1R1LHS0_9MICC|nr:hypothetical protein [Tersicoccus phoenicis]OMH27052.1 hypothetical protein BKD30_03950 [Tersicoccus phoenicis]
MTETDPAAAGRDRGPRCPIAVLVLAGLVVLQVVGVLVVASWYGAALFSSRADSLGGAVFTLVLLLLVAGWQAVSAIALTRGRRWARAAVLVWQFFLFALAVPSLTGGFWGWALLLGLPALAVIYLLFRGDVVAFTTPTPAAG